MNITQLLFSFKGRINRITFWTYTLAVFIVTWVLYRNILKIPMFLPFYLCIPVWIRRLHDQNKTGSWLLCIGFPIGLYYTSWFTEKSSLMFIAIVTTTLGYLVIFTVCGFFKGTEGSNEYDNDVSLTVKILGMTIQSFLISIIVVILNSPIGSIIVRIIWSF